MSDTRYVSRVRRHTEKRFEAVGDLSKAQQIEHQDRPLEPSMLGRASRRALHTRLLRRTR